MTEFLKALSSVAGSPLALVGYIVIVSGWLVVSLNVRRANSLFNVIKELPEADRLKAIALEYRTSPRSGLTAQEWLQSRKIYLLFAGFGLTLLFLLTTVAFAFYLLQVQKPANKARSSVEELVQLENLRALTIIRTLSRYKAETEDGKAGLENPEDKRTIDQAEADFLSMHNAYIDSLKQGNFVLAHDVETKIQRLLASLQKRFKLEHEQVDYCCGDREFREPPMGIPIVVGGVITLLFALAAWPATVLKSIACVRVAISSFVKRLQGVRSTS